MKKLFFTLSFIGLIIVINGCSLSTGFNTTPMLNKVKVDSLQYPLSDTVGDTFIIYLYGIVGVDGCHSLSKIEANKSLHQIDMTVWGQVKSSNACPSVMVYLGGTSYKVLAQQKGTFLINVHQPDGTILVDSVQVK